MAKNSEVNCKVRVVLQQCLSAKLMVQPASEDKKATFVEIKRGMLVYICFLKGATAETVDRMVKAVLSCKLCDNGTGKPVSIIDLPGDLLIIPQATLGGRLKGKSMQYHLNIDKEIGQTLYEEFAKSCESLMLENVTRMEHGVVVKCGTYGNRQVLNVETNGPFTHIIEL